MTVNASDSDERWLYRAGGISALAIGVGYIAIFPLFARVGAPPSSGGELWLKYLEGKTTVWWSILYLCVLTDFLFVPVAISLHLLLERINRGAMLAGTAFIGLFVVLDLAVTWTNYSSLLNLTKQYAAATDDAHRLACIAAANYASAVLSSRTEVFYAIVDLSIGILIIGCVMLQGQGIFSKTTGYLAVAAGISGIASITGFFPMVIVNALLTTAWILFTGYRLLRLSRSA